MSLPVYDVVLLPPTDVNQAAIRVSQDVAKLGTAFTLSQRIYPHLSLYMANFTPEALSQVQAALDDIAKRVAIPLEATKYHANEQGMCEVFYRKTPAIKTLQHDIITALNPLRVGLRIKDPVGRLLSERLAETKGELHHNLVTYGYDEVGSFFKPHITFTRFTKRGRRTPHFHLPPVASFNATFGILGLFEMGEHGTCIRQIAVWPFTASATR